MAIGSRGCRSVARRLGPPGSKIHSMCGIAGVTGGSESRETVERMIGRLSHRGPDDSGVWEAPGVCLGHTRLAILDLSAAGHQPMTFGPYTIVYNGEVYNFRELRQELKGPFCSETDTEVLLHLYDRDGPEMVHALRGMFAFAIWDERQRRLFAARDRLGIKPFFYREVVGGVAFASEIKALLELGRPPVDRTALSDYFSYKYVPHPKTIYEGMSRLPPAHRLVWDGKLRIDRYWTPDPTTRITSDGLAVERLGEMLSEIVPEHTLADVPIGLFLSGGIDSTTLAVHLERPSTYTLGMDVARRDETEAARSVAKYLGTDHHEEVAEASDLSNAIDMVPRVYDEPFGDSAAWSTFLVSRMARRHVKVALSGEGGDELFLGYHYHSKWLTHRSTPLNRLLGPVLPPLTRPGASLRKRAATGLERYAAFQAPFTPAQKRAMLSPDLVSPDYDDLWHLRRFWREDLEPLRRVQWVDIHAHLPGGLLTKVDRASMAHSLEVRPPLLDHRLVEFALSVDPRLLRDVEGRRGKLIVRRLMEGRVPEGLFDRPKRGFALPIRDWAKRHPVLVKDALRRLRGAGIIRRPAVGYLSGDQVWCLLVLDRWMDYAGQY